MRGNQHRIDPMPLKQGVEQLRRFHLSDRVSYDDDKACVPIDKRCIPARLDYARTLLTKLSDTRHVASREKLSHLRARRASPCTPKPQTRAQARPARIRRSAKAACRRIATRASDVEAASRRRRRARQVALARAPR